MNVQIVNVQGLTFLCILLTLGLILLGSGVHIQEQSLNCPRWPLCYGQTMPDVGQFPWMALAHRLLASLVGILTIANSLYLHRKRERFGTESLQWSWWASAIVVFQGLLGALTVKYKLPTLISTAHLVFSAIFLCSLWGLYSSFQRSNVEKSDFFRPAAMDWSLVMLGIVFLQIILGGLVRHGGAAQACGVGASNALLCFDRVANTLTWWPTLSLAKWHFTHRLMAVFVTGIVGVGAWQIRKSIGTTLDRTFFIRHHCYLLAMALAGQVSIGLWAVARELAVVPRLLHLFFAMMTLLLCFGLYLKLKFIGQSVSPGHPTPLEDIMDLAKPRLTALVTLTALVGLLLAPDAIHPLRGVVALVGIAALVAGACALNCYLEKDVDKKMQRTKERALPSGRLSPVWVLVGFSLLVLSSLCLLWFGANPLTALLGLLATVLYLCAYTPLKKRSTLSLFIGAVPGALPPVLGQTAVTGSLNSLSLILFAIIFIWQIPHFISIGLYREDDYRRAKLKITSLKRGHQAARWQILAYGLTLVPVSLLPFFFGLVGKGYFYWGLLLGVGLNAYALQGVHFFGNGFGDGFDTRRWARRYFFATLGYLPLLFIALITAKH